jgi:delta-aminolevulinic acid dehydratase/porphobilinogen synthase
MSRRKKRRVNCPDPRTNRRVQEEARQHARPGVRRDLANIVPNMLVKPTFTPLEVTTAIRGVSELIPSIAVDTPVATYVDGLYNALNAGSMVGALDRRQAVIVRNINLTEKHQAS